MFNTLIAWFSQLAAEERSAEHHEWLARIRMIFWWPLAKDPVHPTSTPAWSSHIIVPVWVHSVPCLLRQYSRPSMIIIECTNLSRGALVLLVRLTPTKMALLRLWCDPCTIRPRTGRIGFHPRNMVLRTTIIPARTQQRQQPQHDAPCGWNHWRTTPVWMLPAVISYGNCRFCTTTNSIGTKVSRRVGVII